VAIVSDTSVHRLFTTAITSGFATENSLKSFTFFYDIDVIVRILNEDKMSKIT